MIYKIAKPQIMKHWLGLILACFALPSVALSANRLCVVPIKNSAGIKVGGVTMFPSLPFPLIRPSTIMPVWRDDAYTVDDAHVFGPFDGPHPKTTYRDQWTFEVATGRVVALGGRLRNKILFANPGEHRFRAAIELRGAHTIKHIARLNGTFLGTTRGLMAVDGDRIGPVFHNTAPPIRSVSSIFDLHKHRAVILYEADLSNRTERPGRVLLRRDDSSIVTILESKRDRIMSVDEFQDPNRILVRTSKKTVVVETSGVGEQLTVMGVYPLPSVAGRRSGGSHFVSTQMNLYLVYGLKRDQSFLERLRDIPKPLGGLERLEGHTLVPFPIEEPLKYRIKKFFDVPSRNIVLMQTGKSPERYTFDNTGLISFDGKKVTRIQDSSSNELGIYIYAYDVPAIGKVLLKSELGLFELTRQNTIKRVSVPLDLKKHRVEGVGEMPASKAVILATSGGVFSMDAEGEVRAVPGGINFEANGAKSIYGVIPVRNEMLLAGAKGLSLVVDESSSRNSICNAVSP